MTNLINKYKDRSPEETIKIITNFFQSQGYKIKISVNEQTESGSWWCRILLIANDIEFLGANGKGTTEQYSLASGHAELFERFCNGIRGQLECYTINKFIKSFNKNTYNYYLAPEEKEMSYEDALYTSPRLATFFADVDDGYGALKEFYLEQYPEGFYALPYKGLNNKENIYLVPEIVLSVIGSSGMAAGNTVEEAITQGCSEVFEHYVRDRLYDITNFKSTYYLLNLDSLKLPEYLRDIIKNIKEKNYNIYLYDFSYNYNMPVLGLYIADLNNNVSYFNLGAAPCFDIACERVFTEIYQGRPQLYEGQKSFMIPARESDLYSVKFLEAFSITVHRTYAEELLTRAKIVDDYNKNIFLQENNYSNLELNKYCINIFNNLGWDVYYRNWSPIKEMAAVQIFVNNVTICDISINLIKRLNRNEKYKCIQAFTNFNKVIKETLNGEIDNNTSVFKTIALLLEDNNNEKNALFHFLSHFTASDMHCNNFLTIGKLCSLLIDTKNCYRDYNKIIQKLKEHCSYLMPSIYKYMTLFLYAMNSKYTNKEIIDIGKFYGFNYLENEIIDIHNFNMRIFYLILKPLQEYYSSSQYQSFLNSFIQ